MATRASRADVQADPDRTEGDVELFNPDQEFHRTAIRWAFAGLTLVIAACFAVIAYEAVMMMIGR
jgi:hypothetical protein